MTVLRGIRYAAVDQLRPKPKCPAVGGMAALGKMTAIPPRRDCGVFLRGALLVLWLVLAAAGPTAAEPLLMGVYDNHPLMIVDSENRSSGFLVDVVNRIAGQESWEVIYRPGTWSQCLEWLRRGEVDLLGGIAYGEHRARDFDFSRESLITEWGQVYVTPGVPIDGVADLNGRKVAVLLDDLHFSNLRVLVQQFGIQCRFVEAEDYETVLMLVEARRCDAGLVNQFYGAYHGKDFRVAKSPIVFSPVKIFFAAPKERHPELLEKLDRRLIDLKQDPGSIYFQAMDRWFGGLPEKPAPVWIPLAALAAAGLVAAVVLLNLLLQRTVRRKTRELSAKNTDLLAEILQRRQAEEILHRQHEYLMALHETALGLIRRLNLDDLLKAIVSRAGVLLEAREGFVYLYEAGENRLVLKAGLGDYATALGHRLAPGEGLVGLTWQEGAPRAVADYPSWPGRRPRPVSGAIHSVVAVPLASGTRTTGVIGLTRDRPNHPFAADEQRVLEQFAELAAIAIDNATLYTQLQLELGERQRMEKERRAMEDQLLQAQKMEAIGTLAGGIAHDFNNILGAMIGYTELCLYDLSPGHPARSNLDQVLRAGSRARDLVKQILAFSRKSEAHRSLINVVPIVSEVAKLLRASLPATITIRQEVDPAVGMILADPIQVHQVLMNLCTNAAHAMEESGGALAVRVVPVTLAGGDHGAPGQLAEGAYIRLQVSDTGSGIDPAVMDRIFDPYFTTKPKDKGTGMGLAVVHGIVSSQGGAVAVDSRMGAGTTFTVWFPMAEREAAPREQAQPVLLPGTERVLLVDDEAALVDLGQAMLTRLGYRVTTRTSSLEALEAFRADPLRYDLVITDMTMPNMTGDRLADAVRTIRPEIPVILCTGYSERMSEEKARAMGIAGFLYKPLLLEQLSRTIREALAETAGKPVN
jgi:signal transduction histidine kinase/CheY-like chemotaxis protein/ABC-type amino acid transport substrate-binding protein